eukprot:TRINITY_DN13756_c0_g1_i3.p1 TRINITY_DN13756_c0_g1~~TRINITY_DN13756_c0_g1_i3.p1  ORF type:complete len:147 (-),score=22.33 TRINITY_DN13756_c0_g1_i3:64-504(-)
MCFVVLITHMMRNPNKDYDTHLNLCGLFFVMFLQEGRPWDIEFTIFPIVTYIILFFVFAYKNGRFPSYDKKVMCKGLMLMLCAFVFFAWGLDEKNDRFRFFHGMWHTFVGFATFYLWQSALPADAKKVDLYNFYLLTRKKRSHKKP